MPGTWGDGQTWTDQDERDALAEDDAHRERLADDPCLRITGDHLTDSYTDDTARALRYAARRRGRQRDERRARLALAPRTGNVGGAQPRRAAA